MARVILQNRLERDAGLTRRGSLEELEAQGHAIVVESRRPGRRRHFVRYLLVAIAGGADREDHGDGDAAKEGRSRPRAVEPRCGGRESPCVLRNLESAIDDSPWWATRNDGAAFGFTELRLHDGDFRDPR